MKTKGDAIMLLDKRQSVFIVIVLAMTGLLASCQSTPPLATSSAPGISVGISDDLCPSVSVQVGQQVTWTNQGSQEHIVRDKAVESKSQFDSGILKPGDNFVFTFLQPASYTYDCSADGVLTGTITVEP
jgi:hypothetical protein